MKTLLAIFSILTILIIVSCGEDDSPFNGADDSGDAMTCEEFCYTGADCLYSASSTAYKEAIANCDRLCPYDEWIDDLRNDIHWPCYQMMLYDNCSCDEYMDCIDNPEDYQ